MHVVEALSLWAILGFSLPTNVLAFSSVKTGNSLRVVCTRSILSKEKVLSTDWRKHSSVTLYLSSASPTSVNESAVAENMEEVVPVEPTFSEQKTEDVSKLVQNNLSFLQTLGAITGRGEMIVNNKNRSPSSRKQYDAALKVAAELEAMNPISEPTFSDQIHGTWELVFSTTQLFRSSPFFMAGRAVCTNEVDSQRYNWFCDMHRASLSISSIQSVRQIITKSNRLISEFETNVGAIPFLSDFSPFRYSGGLPISITGAIVSTADVTPTKYGTGWEVYMDTVDVKGSNVPILRQILDNESVGLRSRSLEQAISSYKTPKPIFRTTFLDGQYRISRDEDDNIFFYVKTSNSTLPTDFSNIDADLGIGRLLEGFNDAITKVYI